MMKLINDLWLKRRDIVSDGFDESLEYISKIIPLKIHKIPTGTKCWTWIVPEKWTVSSAFIEDLDGKRMLNLKDHPLHIVSYSLPIDKIVSKEELFQHLHTNPERPDAVPFEFKYYQKDWGFCIQDNKLKEFTKDKYKVFIDSKFEKGNLKVGDYTIKGKTDKIIILAAHLCHPGQANDDLAGVSVLVALAKAMSKKNNYYTYKFLFVPETIGSIAYLSQNEDLISKIECGIFLEMLGSDDIYALQLTKQGDARIDRIARYVMKRELKKFTEGAFRTVVANDEIAFNGPGVNIPMISISKYPYPEYHTSDDNPAIISEQRLEKSRDLILEILNIIDRDFAPKRNFKGPIFLSGYGFWVDWRENLELNQNIEKIMLNLEGDKTVFDIAEELDMKFNDVLDFVNKLKEIKLVKNEK
ncbi:MAG: DUF4910 domain-containing protein [Patescibacteria group bacterium]